MRNMSRSGFVKRLLPIALCCGILLVFVVADIPCVIRTLTGLPCPMCGMSRAWLAALRLDFLAAFRYHPMFWSVPVLLLWWLFDGRLFRRQWMNHGLLGLMLAGMAVCYLVRIVAFLSGNVTV